MLLDCGDVGQGGMCDWNKIVHVIEKRLALSITESGLRDREECI